MERLLGSRQRDRAEPLMPSVRMLGSKLAKHTYELCEGGVLQRANAEVWQPRWISNISEHDNLLQCEKSTPTRSRLKGLLETRRSLLYLSLCNLAAGGIHLLCTLCDGGCCQETDAHTSERQRAVSSHGKLPSHDAERLLRGTYSNKSPGCTPSASHTLSIVSAWSCLGGSSSTVATGDDS